MSSTILKNLCANKTVPDKTVPCCKILPEEAVAEKNYNKAENIVPDKIVTNKTETVNIFYKRSANLIFELSISMQCI